MDVSVGVRVAASAAGGGVSVCPFSVSVMVDQIRVGIISHATVAAIVNCDAINELLLRQRLEAIASNGVSRLNSASCGKGPA